MSMNPPLRQAPSPQPVNWVTRAGVMAMPSNARLGGALAGSRRLVGLRQTVEAVQVHHRDAAAEDRHVTQGAQVVAHLELVAFAGAHSGGDDGAVAGTAVRPGVLDVERPALPGGEVVDGHPLI